VTVSFWKVVEIIKEFFFFLFFCVTYDIRREDSSHSKNPFRWFSKSASDAQTESDTWVALLTKYIIDGRRS